MTEKDIWMEAVKYQANACKRSLLDYIDALAKNDPNKDKINGVIEQIKAKIHNDVGSLHVNFALLLKTLQSGGDISPLGERFNKNGSKN